ncbi:MAG: carbohydrate kinase family protein [Candidatus Bathyarchaeia archaeon]
MKVLCAGSFMIDIVAPHLPAITPPGGLIYAPKGITLSIGGHAVNVSVDLAQLGQSGVAAAGCIGDDILGRYIQETLGAIGVEARPQVLKSTPTAKNIALTVEGEDRRFIAELAANTLLTPDHIEFLLTERPRIFFLGTIGGLKYIDANLKSLLAVAHASGATTVVDVIQPTEPDWSHLTRAMNGIDILHLNEEEAHQVTGLVDPISAARRLRTGGANTIIVTKGSSGLFALRGDAEIIMPGFRIEEVDATGAGDALCAGLIHSLMETGNPSEASEDEFIHALLEGQAAGAACVTSAGATTSVNSKSVKALLREQGEAILNSATLRRGNISK